MLLNKTFQVQIDSKENHNPYVGCPQYKCKKLTGEKFNMMQWLTENEIALYSNSPKYFVEKTPPKLPNASISVESKDDDADW